MHHFEKFKVSVTCMPVCMCIHKDIYSVTYIFLLDRQHFVLDSQNPNYIENAIYRVYLCLNKMSIILHASLHWIFL